MNNKIVIDGSQGEGGGQMLRTSLSMSAITGQAFEMINVRAKRKTPGLKRQHLTCLKAAAEVCDAKVEGVEVGSMYIKFAPQAIKAGEYRFDIGTAGSVTLVAQTILPILLCAKGESFVTITGGTHVPMSPAWEFFENSYLGELRKMGAEVEAEIVKYGFYPAGGGEITLKIRPWKSALPYKLIECGKLVRAKAVARVANLHKGIADDELEIIRKGLPQIALESKAESIQSIGPGNYSLVELDFENVTKITTEIGTYDKSRKAVANTVVDRSRSYLNAEAPVDSYLSDQLLVPMAVASTRMVNEASCLGEFVMPRKHTLHFDTNWMVLNQFVHEFEMQESPINEKITNIKILKKGI